MTPRCNARCRHCAYDGGPEQSGLLAADVARAFLDAFCRRWGPPRYAGLTGGEPMLYPERTLGLARALAEKGAIVRLLTNASWARSDDLAIERVSALRASGVSGLWVSASTFHLEHVPLGRVRTLLAAASRAGLPVYVNFTYLHPSGQALRGKGLPDVDPAIADDARTRLLHQRLSGDFPFIGHGWARVWDQGRAKSLIAGLGPEGASRAREDLARAAERAEGSLLDLVGLGSEGEVFFREVALGRAGKAGFAPLFEQIHPEA